MCAKPGDGPILDLGPIQSMGFVPPFSNFA